MEDADLKRFGWAPGNYTIICADCVRRLEGDKRCWRCRPCAVKAHAAEIASPTTRAGWMEACV